MTLFHEATEDELRAERFVTRLASCSLDEWRRAAATAERERTADDCARLAALVAAPEVALVAWRLRDMVCTCVHRFRQERVAPPPREIRRITAATEWTAEALLVQSALPADSRDRLLRPFQHLISPDAPR